MKKLLTLILIILPFIGFSATYDVDLANLDALIENAQEVGYTDFQTNQPADLASFAKIGNQAQFTNKNVTTAFVLGLFLGSLGVHRLYLGTSIGVFIVYIITQAGCGVLYFVDNILLLMALLDNSAIDVYVDNPHFFMWTK
jgi:TM2 domain-containing membrane protein YozV